MKILFDINHPAHAHFFKHSIHQLSKEGHHCIITSREKDITTDILDKNKIRHQILSKSGSNIIDFLTELIYRNYQLTRIVRQERPNVMLSIGGTFIAHTSVLTGVPALVFYDTENAKLQNLITYPFATKIYTPACYTAWVPAKKHVRYPGYHELSYLHPNQFSPNKKIAIENGLDQDKETIFIRLVSWKANHDVGEKGWNNELLRKVIEELTPKHKVLISSESKLPKEFEKHLYSGNLEKVHHVLAYCRGFIGESATMASESAVLGVPALYIANTGRGYTTEIEKKYKLVINIHSLEWPAIKLAINELLIKPSNFYKQAHKKLLADTIDVSKFIIEKALSYQRV